MFVFFFKQKTAYEMRISDWSSDVCSSDLPPSPAAISEAKTRLQAIGALAGDGRITVHGKALAAIPLPVPLAHMLLDAARAGQAEIEGRLAVPLPETGPGGPGIAVEEFGRPSARARGGAYV